MKKWQAQIPMCVIPTVTNEYGLLTSTNVGRYISKPVYPQGDYVHFGPAMYNAMQNHYFVKGSGSKAQSDSPKVTLTKDN